MRPPRTTTRRNAGESTVFLVDVLVGFAAAFLLFGPAIYTGLQVIPNEKPVEYPVAAATALLAILVAGFVDGLLGWIPVIGIALSPLAWSAMVKRLTETSWLASLGIGTACWALSKGLYAGLSGA